MFVSWLQKKITLSLAFVSDLTGKFHFFADSFSCYIDCLSFCLYLQFIRKATISFRLMELFRSIFF